MKNTDTDVRFTARIKDAIKTIDAIGIGSDRNSDEEIDEANAAWKHIKSELLATCQRPIIKDAYVNNDTRVTCVCDWCGKQGKRGIIWDTTNSVEE